MSSIQPVSKQFALHSKLFNNVLEGIEDIKGSKRLSERVNHLQWIAGHVTNSRYRFTAPLGLEMSFPYADCYNDFTQPPPFNRIIDSSVKYPSLTEIKKYWNELAPVFVERISGLTAVQLESESAIAVPTGKSLLDLFSFIASHESYHIGQMSIIRKYLGLSAMSYE
jgi:hypothetical protein